MGKSYGDEVNETASPISSWPALCRRPSAHGRDPWASTPWGGRKNDVDARIKSAQDDYKYGFREFYTTCDCRKKLPGQALPLLAEQFVERGGEAGEIGLARQPVVAFLAEGDHDVWAREALARRKLVCQGTASSSMRATAAPGIEARSLRALPGAAAVFEQPERVGIAARIVFGRHSDLPGPAAFLLLLASSRGHTRSSVKSGPRQCRQAPGHARFSQAPRAASPTRPCSNRPCSNRQ